jgi:hypothetical protein
MKNKTAIDPYSGETFQKSRSNKRFANLRNKNAYHNAFAKKERDRISNVQKPLLRNRKILELLLGEKEEVTVSRDFLLGRGYNFTCYTGSDQKRRVFLIYEFEISDSEGKIKIRRGK